MSKDAVQQAIDLLEGEAAELQKAADGLKVLRDGKGSPRAPQPTTGKRTSSKSTQSQPTKMKYVVSYLDLEKCLGASQAALTPYSICGLLEMNHRTKVTEPVLVELLKKGEGTRFANDGGYWSLLAK